MGKFGRAKLYIYYCDRVRICQLFSTLPPFLFRFDERDKTDVFGCKQRLHNANGLQKKSRFPYILSVEPRFPVQRTYFNITTQWKPALCNNIQAVNEAFRAFYECWDVCF